MKLYLTLAVCAGLGLSLLAVGIAGPQPRPRSAFVKWREGRHLICTRKINPTPRKTHDRNHARRHRSVRL